MWIEDGFFVENGVLLKYRGSASQLIVPEGIRIIFDSAFSGCSGLERVQLPDSLTTIGDRAFAWCFSLQELRVPDGVTDIGEEAFLECCCLRTVTLPAGLKTVGPGVFEKCEELERLLMPGGAPLPEITKENEESCIDLYLYGSCPVDGAWGRACAALIQKRMLQYVPEVFRRNNSEAAERLLRAYDYLPPGVIDLLIDISVREGNTDQTALLLDYRDRHPGDTVSWNL